MPAAKIIRPTIEYKDSYVEAIREFQTEGRMKNIDPSTLRANFDEYVNDLCEEKGAYHHLFADWVEPVPETVLWMVKDGEFIGYINIRHRLNWHLEKWGGHMSIAIRPSMRKKGYGKKLLRKGIPFANYLGIEQALITMDPENTAARSIVEACGGVEDEITTKTEQFPSRIKYWLDCT